MHIQYANIAFTGMNCYGHKEAIAQQAPANLLNVQLHSYVPDTGTGVQRVTAQPCLVRNHVG
jgi:hypothetical protein